MNLHSEVVHYAIRLPTRSSRTQSEAKPARAARDSTMEWTFIVHYVPRFAGYGGLHAKAYC